MALVLDESWYRNGNGRVCAVCGKDKGIKEFAITKQNTRGWTCIECLKTRNAIAYAAKLKNHQLRDGIIKKAETVLKRSLAKAKTRLKHGESNIDLRYLITLYYEQDGRCALSGRNLVINQPGRGKHRDSLSIDRIDSTKGYIIGNIQLITYQVNIAKYNYPQEDFLELCRDVLRFNGIPI